jgi:hypothetical protein
MSKPTQMRSNPRCGSCVPSWGHQPSGLDYDLLISSLSALKFFQQAGEVDQLGAGIKALGLVIQYLNSNRLVGGLGLTRPLAQLAVALHDVGRGAKPALIFGRAPKVGRGVPTLTSKAGLRAQVNLMFDYVANGGLVREEAAKELAGTLKRTGIKENGKAITPKRILRWRQEIGGKSLSGSDRVYARLKAGAERRGWPKDLVSARRRVQRLIRALRAAGF